MNPSPTLPTELEQKFENLFSETEDGEIRCAIDQKLPHDTHIASLYEIKEFISQVYQDALTEGARQERERIRTLVDEYDESDDIQAGFEIRIKKAVQFRTKLSFPSKESK